MKTELGALAHITVEGDRVEVSCGGGGARVNLLLNPNGHVGRVTGAVAVNSTGSDLHVMSEVEASRFIVEHGGDFGAAEAALLRILDPAVGRGLTHIPAWATAPRIIAALRKEMKIRAEGGLVEWRGSIGDFITQVLGRSGKGRGPALRKAIVKALDGAAGVRHYKDPNRKTDYFIIRTPVAAGLVPSVDDGVEGYDG
jgi:hypothetical protein